MKKVIFISSLIICVLIVLTGCGDIGKVNEKNITEDLSGKTIIVSDNNISSKFDFTKLKKPEIKGFKVTKESLNKDSKQDIIYGQLKLSYTKNDNNTGAVVKYDANGQVKITYNYYDKAWIIDKVEASELNNWKINSSNVSYMALPDMNVTSDNITKDFGNDGSGIQTISNIKTSNDVPSRKEYVEFDASRDSSGVKSNEHWKFTYHYSDAEKKWSLESKQNTSKSIVSTPSNNANTSSSTATSNNGNSNNTDANNSSTNGSLTEAQALNLLNQKEGSEFTIVPGEDQGGIQNYQGKQCYSFFMSDKNTPQDTTFYVEISTGKIYNEVGGEVN
ncbi:MAG: hypothetical protein PHX70_00620 [Clostridium sp.]|nr:hypothetical protein [Clostridium sp.]